MILIKLKIFPLPQDSRGAADQSRPEGALFTRRWRWHVLNVISVKVKLDLRLAGHSSFSLRVSRADELWKSN